MVSILHVVFALIYVLVTFFGIGPVLLADGTTEERIFTMLIVLVILAILIVLHLRLAKKLKKS